MNAGFNPELNQLLARARRANLIDGAQRAAILSDPAANAAVIADLEERLRADSFFGRVSGTLGRQVRVGGIGIPLWAVIVVVILFVTSGFGKLTDLLPKTADIQGTSEALTASLPKAAEVWIQVGEKAYIPINRKPFPKVPFQDVTSDWVVAAVLLLVNILPAFRDNATPRGGGSQRAATVSNFGMIFFFVGACLWSYWAPIIAFFSAWIMRRERKGNIPNIGTSLIVLILGLWMWFDRFSPTVNKWLDQLQSNPNFGWVTSFLRFITEGENSRWLGLAALILVLGFSVFSKTHDSSTLVVMVGFIIAWRLIFGVWLYAESMPVWLDKTLLIGLPMVALICSIVEQYQNGIPMVFLALILLYGMTWAVSYAVRDLAGINPEDNTFWKWITTPVVAIYIMMIVMSWVFGQALKNKAKWLDNVTKTLGSWYGFTVPIGPLEFPADLVYTLSFAISLLLLVGQRWIIL